MAVQIGYAGNDGTMYPFVASLMFILPKGHNITLSIDAKAYTIFPAAGQKRIFQPKVPCRVNHEANRNKSQFNWQPRFRGVSEQNLGVKKCRREKIFSDFIKPFTDRLRLLCWLLGFAVTEGQRGYYNFGFFKPNIQLPDVRVGFIYL